MTTKQIASNARQALGRTMSRGTRHVDWAAVQAVQDACRDAGMDQPLLQWVDNSGSLTGLVRAYTYRYGQAYGGVR